MNEIALPRLSDRTLEQLVIAAVQLETIKKLKVQIPLDWIFTPQLLAQLPPSIKR